jgi:tetratricopeptide (TPR) repeat protein
MSGPLERLKTLKGSIILHLILITLVGLLAYSNTFNVPFQWDDKLSIVENAAIRDLSHFMEPLKAKESQDATGYLALHTMFKSRLIGFLTFALNHKIHGLDVRGYHIVNLIVHILNSFLVYWLAVLTFRTPHMKKSLLRDNAGYIALFTGLLFVSHPIQTEAVTYIVQRFASLATTFYLLSLVLYIRWRLVKDHGSTFGVQRRHLIYILSVISAVIAMKTKEIAFTLPLAVATYEFIFFKDSAGKRLIYLVPLFLTMLIIPLTYISLADIDRSLEELTGSDGEAVRAQDISRIDYLFTEFRVIATYMRLLVLPVNQNLDYDYPVYRSFFEPQVFLSFIFLLGVFGFGVNLIRHSLTGEAINRLLAFGIFWFFLTLSVESSIIPLHVIFEHRIYLPSAGAFIAAASYVFYMAHKIKTRKQRIGRAVMPFFALTIMILACATYARNTIWQSESSLWEDVVIKSPNKKRGHINLGFAYKTEGSIDMAIEPWQSALRIEPDPITHHYLALAYSSKGMIDNSIEHLESALLIDPLFADAHRNLGVAYKAKGLTDRGIEHYLIALRIRPNDAESHYNLGIAFVSKGLVSRALEHFQAAIRINPDYANAHNNLGMLYKSQGHFNMAIKHYQAALRLKPDNETVHNNLGNAYDDLGMKDKAKQHYKIALGLKPDYAEAHYNLGLIYLREGQTENAREELQSALRLNPGLQNAKRLLGRIVDPE